VPGGTLQLDDNTPPGPAVSGFVRGDVIDLRGLPFDPGDSVVYDAPSGVLSVASGSLVDTLGLPGVAAGTLFALFADGFGGTAVRAVPPAPGGLGLAPGSDSGVAGDNRTNVTSPLLLGQGEAGDTVSLFEAGAVVGGGTVGADGVLSATAAGLAPGVHVLSAVQTDRYGDVSAPSGGLSVTIDTSVPVVSSPAVSPVWNGGAAPLGIAAPSDDDDAPEALSIVVTHLPANGTVSLSGGGAVGLGQTLAAGDLAGLRFTPGALQVGRSDNFGYLVTDPAGNGAFGAATISVAASAPTVFDFVYLYQTGGDYYYGTVVDDGTFGYQAGQAVSGAAGRYDIFNQRSQATPLPAGTVSVVNYTHNGTGQASAVPVLTAGGASDGAGGLGSEADRVRGSDGRDHAFSPLSPASFAGGLVALYGFVFAYADGRAFYTGTVADDGSFGLTPGVTSKTVAGGTYTIFAQGMTTQPAGSVVIDRFVAGDAAFIASHDGAADGVQGLGSETAAITVGGQRAPFGSGLEPDLLLVTGRVVPGAAPGDATGRALNELYLEVLGRDIDASGQATYGAAVAAGTSLAAIRQTLAQSPELQTRLNQLYNQVLGRDLDASGQATYSAAVAAGSSLFTLGSGGPQVGGAIELILAQSGEAQDRIRDIYRDVLGRAADGGGLTTYIAALGNGTPLNGIAGVRGIIAHSPEAQLDLAGGAGVPGLFPQLVGRAPDAAELGAMTDLLSQDPRSGRLTSLPAVQDALRRSGAAVLSEAVTPGGYQTVTATAAQTGYTAAPQVPTLFVFADLALGHDTIAGFDTSRDTIQLPKSRAADFAAVQNATQDTALGATISLNPSQSILLTGIAKTALTPANFEFV
jgi:hypothetical protein